MVNLKKIIYPGVLIFAFGVLVFLQNALALDFKLLSSICLGLTILLIAGLERVLPYRKDWNQDHGDLRMDFFFTLFLFPVIVAVCQFAVRTLPEFLKGIDLSSLPVLIQSLLVLVAAEFMFYWLHRFFHENKHLWKLHHRHHAVQRVYWMNAGTFNPIDLFLNFFIYCLPFAFLKTDPMTFEYVLYFSAVTGLMEHANVDFRAGVLNRILNTAELHRWHHSVVTHESQMNYGKALSVFDLLFGTFKYSEEEDVLKVGVE